MKNNVIKYKSTWNFPLAKHPFGINREKYKGKGRPKKNDYYKGIIMSQSQ